ncbi:hypothetical protein [Lacinutrix salivirga]
MNDFNEAEDILFEVDSLISQEKIVEAKDLLYQVLESFPDYCKAHNHLGWIFHQKITNYPKAEAHFKLALKYANGYFAPYINYSYYLLDVGKYNEMIEFGEKSLKIEGVDKGTILNQMGKAFELTNKLETAYLFYKEAKINSTASGYIEEINASLYRVKDKMNVFQKIKFIFK